MRYGSVAIAYREQRFITPHLKHLPDWVEPLVLVSTKPWFGEDSGSDGTAQLAKDAGAAVIETYWQDETQQRNTGQDLHMDKDWIIVLDPDEFLDNENWDKLKDFLETTDADAVIVDHQRVFWKNKEVSPCKDYQQLIAVRPNVRFVDKRVVGSPYVVAPVELLHFSWSRTDEEIWDKISHYAHAYDFDTKYWFDTVWKSNKQTNLHPVSPDVLGGLIEPKLPKEIKELNLLWPANKT